MKNLFLIFFLFAISISYGQDNADSAKVYNIVEIEVKPEFPGGDIELLKQFSKLTIPDFFDCDLAFTIRFSFEIDTTGKVQNLTLLRKKEECIDLFNDLEQQLIKLFSELPDWTPGMIRGKKVRVKYIVPLSIHPG